MRRNTWKKGDWLAICDRCGFTFYASELRREWTGLMVCKEDWEERHPQEKVIAKTDRQAPVWVRPEPPATFVNVNYQYTVDGPFGNTAADSAFAAFSPSNEELIEFVYYTGHEPTIDRGNI